MKKRILSALMALCLAASMTACAGSSSQTDSSSVSSSQAESSSAADSSTSADSSSQAAPKYDYVHGTDGYYNLTDELKNFKRPVQQTGTCWLYAARASIQTSYEKQTGKELKMEISDMLDAVYGEGKQEGIFVKNGISKSDLGGYQQFVTDRLSRECKDGITLDSSMIIDPTDRETIKNAVRTRGGVTVGIDSRNCEVGMFGTYPTLIYKQAKIYDHAVTVIGWDDHFPKEYFKTPAEQDGAWIVYNSNLGEMCQYISYCAPLEYAISHTVSDKYSQVQSYDAGNVMSGYIKTGDSTKAANVFHKKGKLAAVGTFNNFDKQDIKIEIMSADFKNTLYTQDASLGYQGYQTVELTKPVDVENYAVVITYSKGAPVEGETIGFAVASYKTSIEKGQSFVFADGKWKDMTDSDINKVIKTDKVRSFIDGDCGAWKKFLTSSDIEAIKNPDFAPGNACIKALYAK
jgi:hypothetical protein